MTFDNLYLIYFLLGLGCLMLVEGVYFLVVDLQGRRRDPNRRLRMLSSGKTRDEVMVSLRRERRLTPRFRPLAWFEGLLVQAGVRIGLVQMLLVMLALAAGGLLFGYLARGDLTSALGGAVVAGLVLPPAVLMLKRRARLRRFESQFPDAIDMMVRGLRAGHPVTAAISLVARELPDPVGSEFGLAMDEMTYGFELDRALKNLRDRVGSQDVGFLVVAVSIQVQLGGNLAEVLSNLSHVIRERLKMKLKIKAVSAEGRFSAVVLSIVPFGLVGMLTFLNPDFYSGVQDDPIFMPVMTGAFVMMIFGIIVMWRMVNFRV
ncbi:MAG: type II secretion system F family protein [Dongiaceae bacterium]